MGLGLKNTTVSFKPHPGSASKPLPAVKAAEHETEDQFNLLVNLYFLHAFIKMSDYF